MGNSLYIIVMNGHAFEIYARNGIHPDVYLYAGASFSTLKDANDWLMKVRSSEFGDDDLELGPLPPVQWGTNERSDEATGQQGGSDGAAGRDTD